MMRQIEWKKEQNHHEAEPPPGRRSEAILRTSGLRPSCCFRCSAATRQSASSTEKTVVTGESLTLKKRDDCQAERKEPTADRKDEIGGKEKNKDPHSAAFLE